MTKIGKYEIIEEIGRGAMGVVFKAYDPLIRREVAIKVLMQGALVLPEIKERFYREAQSVGMLYHENITIVHDIGEIDGKPYLVMEYLSGTDLRALIANKASLALSQKLEYFKQICRGLQFAHAKGVVHRDIKPENIKILPDGKVKIMDFGIARPEASDLTQTGTMLGTPCYMSPEQIKGGKVDKRADIFALGVVLYELLLYKKPFDGQMATVIYKIIHEEPAPIEVNPSGVTADLQKVLTKCLAKAVEARYGDCAEVLEALEEISATAKQQDRKVSDLLAQARVLIAQKKIPEALPPLEEILKIEFTNAEALALRQQCEAGHREPAPITQTVADKMVGATVSHYKIMSQLGAGGMGVIYKAEDLRLKRPVALKFLAPGLTADVNAKERFIREAQAASALDHPNICTIHEIDETPVVPDLSAPGTASQLFIAMAYYDGQTLKGKIAKANVAPSDCLDLVMQMAQGLVKAHEHGIVHRDIKPANVIITKDGLVKILDFGLAKLAGATKNTRAEMTAGTLSYMSPEQVRGAEADHRTDIWSLGVILFQLLTGQLPFSGDYPMSILYSIVHEDPAPLLQFNSSLPAEFDQVIGRALQKSAEARYTSMQLMLDALKQIQRRHYRKKEHEAPPAERIVKTAAKKSSYRDDEEKTRIQEAVALRPAAKDSPRARKSTAKRLAFGVALIVLVGLAGLWQLWPTRQTPDSAALSQPALAAQNEMQKLKAEAEQARAEQWALASYQQAIQEEQRGDDALRQQNFAAAQQAFNAATDYFRNAAAEARRNAEAATADLAMLKEDAHALQQEMLNAKAAAEKAEARTKTPELFNQAAAREQRGDENLAANDRGGYLAAKSFYAEARDFYKKAGERAVLASNVIATPNPRLLENAEAARSAMTASKRQITASEKDKAASATYQSALGKEAAGERQFRDRNFAAARNSFEQAGNLFSRAGEEMALTAAKNQAEVAKAAMLAAERKLDAVNHAGATYQEAQRLAVQAAQADQDGDFVKASTLYRAAQQRYENVAREASDEAAKESAGVVAAQNAIQALSDRLKTSIETEDLLGMKAVYGASFSKDDEKGWTGFFKIAKAINVEIQSKNLAIRDNTAHVALAITIDYRNNINERKQADFSEKWTLAVSGGKWMVTWHGK